MIKQTKPAIYEQLKKKFGVSWEDGVIITYYPDIYWIGGNKLSKEKIVHEETHLRQQEAMGVEQWWYKYLNDESFRLSQEIEAYTNEVKFIKYNIPDRNKQARMIHWIARDLSSSMYGNIISFPDALKLFI